MGANRITVAEWKALHASKGRRKLVKAKLATKRKRKPTPFVERWYGVKGGGLEIIVPLRLKSLNKQENGFARHRRVTKEHGATAPLLAAAALQVGGPQVVCPPRPAWLVTVTRLGPVLFDEDNNSASCKACVDCAARFLGVSDATNSPTKFVRQQEKSPAYGVKIRIEPLKKEAANG